MLTRRRLLGGGCLMAATRALPGMGQGPGAPDYSLEIGPCTVELDAKHSIKTIGYNGQVPGPLLRFREGQPVTIDVTNRSPDAEVVHWHGLFLSPEVDGAMEEGTPMLAPGERRRITFTPRPAGFRWYHTHTSAGGDLKKAQFGGQHGFLMIEPREHAGAYDQEFFLALHDWDGQMLSSDDGSMKPMYRFSTINGKLLGAGEPLRVKEGQRVLLHILNSSPTEVHWVALSGHTFTVVALDGNAVPVQANVSMLRLAPAERVCAVVEMKNPGVWVLGEVRKHLQAAGMGVVVEYAGRLGNAQWRQPQDLIWSYGSFAKKTSEAKDADVHEIPLVFESKFEGHGAPDRWMINGKSYPETDTIALTEGWRYRLRFINKSLDDHPVHLHRHSFTVRRVGGLSGLDGLRKDVLLVPAKTEATVEFVADHPGLTLFHCHQQDHMDNGFMMLFRYA
ncbi:MAG TPA: multicopper oxidase family protein [Acidobacteriaceae bacterium]|nr:multicopper oxidase family protein [Acidobacteriaceae bacterium]